MCLNLQGPEVCTSRRQQVLHDVPQIVRLRGDVTLGVLGVLRTEDLFAVRQQLGEADDGGERGAQLVADRGDQLVLRPDERLLLLDLALHASQRFDAGRGGRELSGDRLQHTVIGARDLGTAAGSRTDDQHPP